MTASEWSDLPLVLTTEQAAAVLQLKRRTVANMLDRGDLRGVKIGKEWRVSRAEVRRFVERQKGLPRPRPLIRRRKEAQLVEKDGLFVITGNPLVNVEEFVEGERERRARELIRQLDL